MLCCWWWWALHRQLIPKLIHETPCLMHKLNKTCCGVEAKMFFLVGQKWLNGKPEITSMHRYIYIYIYISLTFMEREKQASSLMVSPSVPSMHHLYHRAPVFVYHVNCCVLHLRGWNQERTPECVICCLTRYMCFKHTQISQFFWSLEAMILSSTSSLGFLYYHLLLIRNKDLQFLFCFFAWMQSWASFYFSSIKTSNKKHEPDYQSSVIHVTRISSKGRWQ